MIIFALLSSGVAFLLYFRLIADIGPTKSLTVTFLMPAFTMLWASLFLGEGVTALMIFGCALILVGTGLVVMRR
jgi:drug/metabolite transporter (DMT)-like permease